MTPALATWSHRLADVAERGLEVRRVATDQERAEVAAALELLACERLEVIYRLRPIIAGRYAMTGTLVADVTQACVVTLEPLAEHIEEQFDEEFWPPEQLPQPGSGLEAEQEALAVTIAEPIESGRLEVGRVVYERLGTALDPYPRKSGAEIDPQAVKAAAGTPAPGPFAALAKLKKGE